MTFSQTEVSRLQPAPEKAEGPAGIYVHIPFCHAKCPYCSFVSFPDVDAGVKKAYMAALGRQAGKMAVHPWTRDRTFHSLYIGGGTPPSVDISELAAFIENCLGAFRFTGSSGKRPEVSLEANPNTVNTEMLQRLRLAGVNRLSLGIQSFSDVMLRAIGRKHSARDGIQAAAKAREAGFANISLDLMYGLPGQDLAAWQNSLERAASLEPEHLSVYELTVEQGTPFAELKDRGNLALPEEDIVLGMFEQAQDFLSACGYEQYEISSYARQGFQCIHNINYWENVSYIGLGSGAVSCFSGVRIKNEEDPLRFIEAAGKASQWYREAEILDLSGRFRETVIMGLRMTAGVSVPGLQERFGMTPADYYGEVLVSLMRDGLLEMHQDRLRLSRRGLLLANRVMAFLV
jgi:oxygen-independent coproporphyrinogen-3 oxidase